ncbi:MAG: sulfatase [Planctomycetaceae bacterium]|nr:sulfatase [Planctomycetaceae bacterium]
MIRHSFYLTLISLLLIGHQVCFAGESRETAAGPASERRAPNIVMFIVDDLGQKDLGCYGSTFYETPNVDRLATEGVRFTNAYATCPVCSPTRASLITGRYPQRTQITDYIGAAQPAAWKRNTKLLPAPYALQLAHDELTMAEYLREAGYATFFAGKWHLGGDGYLPETQGFDINMGGLAQGGPYGGDKYFSPYGNPKLPDGPKGEHLPDRLATEASKFIEANQSKPFLVYFPFYSVHTPLMAREDLKLKYQKKRAGLTQTDVFADEPPRKVRMTQDHAVYAGMVEAMDQAVGKVLKSLDDCGLTNDTLVIFTSDNGGLSTSEGSPTSNQPLRAGKGWLYEGGIRTASIVRWPGHVTAGTTSDVPIASIDYLPTVLDACEVKPKQDRPLDGVSLLTLLTRSEAGPNRALCWHYPHYGNQGGAPGAAILRDGWKLIEWFEGDRVELFHLPTDESEKSNVAGTEAARVQSMREELHAWQEQVGAIHPTVNPAFDASKADGRK